MNPLKRMLRFCLRPVYRWVKGPARPVLRRLRDYLARPALAQVDSLRERVELLGAQLGSLRESVEAVGAQIQAHHQAVQGILRPLPPAFSAVRLGPNRLLAGHPLLEFLYLDPHDVRVTPRAVLHDYDRGVTAALRQLVRPGAFALEVGAGQGFHTLTLAALAGPTGRVVAVEIDPTSRAVLCDNLAAHGFEERVTVCPEVSALRPVLANLGRFPEVIRLEGPAVAPTLVELRGCVPGAGEIQVLFQAPTGAPPAGGMPVPDWLSGGLEFWLIEEEGVLIPTTPQELAGRAHRLGTHVLAARPVTAALDGVTTIPLRPAVRRSKAC